MKSNENPMIVGLDIGTTKIVAIAGRMNATGKLEVLATGQVESTGVNHGMVLNIEHCTKAIDQAIENCLQGDPYMEIKEVYVGIGGQHIRNIQTNGTRIRNKTDDEISKKDVELLICDQYKTRISHDEQIIDIIPQEYIVDDISDILSPVGMCGSKIDCNFNLITGKSNIIHNIERCISKSFLKTKKIVLQSLASTAAVANTDDLEAGVMILDIGGGTTDMAVYQKGILKFNAVIPIGGCNITTAISDGLGVLRTQAEFLKVQHGNVITTEENELMTTTVQNLKGLPPKEISLKKLSNIIQSNIQEILDYAMYNLKQKNLDKHLHGGIIITGGSSQIKGLAQFTEQITGMGVRIGHPDEHLADNYSEMLIDPQYATCIGLVLQGHEHYMGTYTPPVVLEYKNVVNLIEEPEVKLTINDITEPPFTPSPEMDFAAGQKKKINKGFMDNLKYKFMGIFEKVEDEILA